MKVWLVSVLLCAAFALGTTAVVSVESAKEVEDLHPETKVFDEPSVEENVVVAAENEEQATEEVNSVEQKDRAVYCPPGWSNYRSRCFQLVRSTFSWLNAERHCVSQRASLVSVRDPEEYNFLQSLLTVSGVTSYVWIGAYNFQNTWLWIDRAGFYYTNWQSVSSVTSYPCAAMIPNAGWTNLGCGSGCFFFCSLTPTAC